MLCLSLGPLIKPLPSPDAHSLWYCHEQVVHEQDTQVAKLTNATSHHDAIDHQIWLG